jgi:hypothetical protein
LAWLNYLQLIFPLRCSRKAECSGGLASWNAQARKDTGDVLGRIYTNPDTTIRVKNKNAQTMASGRKTIELRSPSFSPPHVGDIMLVLPVGYARVSHVGGFSSYVDFCDFVKHKGREEGFGCVSVEGCHCGRVGLTRKVLDSGLCSWMALEFMTLFCSKS